MSRGKVCATLSLSIFILHNFFSTNVEDNSARRDIKNCSTFVGVNRAIRIQKMFSHKCLSVKKNFSFLYRNKETRSCYD